MTILNSNIECEKQQWIALWQNWKGKEVFMHPDYINLYTNSDNAHIAYCAIYKENNITLMYPFIKRPINLLVEPVYDITTPYGYGGIFVNGEGDLQLIMDKFNLEFEQWCESENIVSEFIRFSLDSQSRIYSKTTVELNNENIIVDLSLDEQTMWKTVKPKVRKNVNHARKCGLQVVFDSTGEFIDNFLEIYYGTMKRREASDGYYFPEDYFHTINKKLSESYIYCHIFHGNEMISTELVLVGDKNIYSFLGGTKEEFFDMRPNDLLKYEIINWGHSTDKQHFILGGGYTPYDGIYNYKLAFAPNGNVPFYVGKRILNDKIYTELINLKKQNNPDFDIESKFFPLYRS